METDGVTLVTGPSCPECWDDGPHAVAAEEDEGYRMLECGACGNPWQLEVGDLVAAR